MLSYHIVFLLEALEAHFQHKTTFWHRLVEAYYLISFYLLIGQYVESAIIQRRGSKEETEEGT